MYNSEQWPLVWYRSETDLQPLKGERREGVGHLKRELAPSNLGPPASVIVLVVLAKILVLAP